MGIRAMKIRARWGQDSVWLNVCIGEKLLDLRLVWKNTSRGIVPAQKSLLWR